MKVLDKVYIHLTPHLGLLEATAIPVNAPDEQKYIRKDALLEWAKERYQQTFSNVGCYTGHSVWQEVIEKLESL